MKKGLHGRERYVNYMYMNFRSYCSCHEKAAFTSDEPVYNSIALYECLRCRVVCLHANSVKVVVCVHVCILPVVLFQFQTNQPHVSAAINNSSNKPAFLQIMHIWISSMLCIYL